MTSDRETHPSGAPIRFHGDLNTSQSQLFDRSDLDDATLRQISEVMAALGRLRDAEKKLQDASQRYMKLNQTDMRALHFLMVANNQGVVTTPTAIAAHLGISAASTTKLLDRLEKSGHVVREAHPTDRRALVISITPHTRLAAKNSVGRQQARRVYAAARLSPAEREVVIGFLDDMASEIAVGDDWNPDDGQTT